MSPTLLLGLIAAASSTPCRRRDRRVSQRRGGDGGARVGPGQRSDERDARGRPEGDRRGRSLFGHGAAGRPGSSSTRRETATSGHARRRCSSRSRSTRPSSRRRPRRASGTAPPRRWSVAGGGGGARGRIGAMDRIWPPPPASTAGPRPRPAPRSASRRGAAVGWRWLGVAATAGILAPTESTVLVGHRPPAALPAQRRADGAARDRASGWRWRGRSARRWCRSPLRGEALDGASQATRLDAGVRLAFELRLRATPAAGPVRRSARRDLSARLPARRRSARHDRLDGPPLGGRLGRPVVRSHARLARAMMPIMTRAHPSSSLFVAVGMAMLFMLPAACNKQPQEKGQAPQPPAAAPVPAAKPEPTAASGRAALCDKLKAAAAQTIGVATTTSRAMDQEGLPLRCIYDPDSEKGPWFEVQPGGKPQDARTGMKAGGSKITDLPELGPGAFTTKFSFMNWVVGRERRNPDQGRRDVRGPKAPGPLEKGGRPTLTRLPAPAANQGAPGSA